MAISKKRKVELARDYDVVMSLYQHACDEFGKAATDKDLTRVWDLRCMWGMKRILPFGSTTFTSLGELWYVMTDVCGLPIMEQL